MNTQSVLLHRARALIATGEECFVCFAIEDSATDDEERRVANELREWINESLDPKDTRDGCPTVDWWLQKKRVPLKLLTSENLRAYRVRWIDQMLEIWKD